MNVRLRMYIAIYYAKGLLSDGNCLVEYDMINSTNLEWCY